MTYIGDLNPSDVFDKKFFTVNPAQTPTTLGGTPVVAILKSNSTALTTAGITLTTDFGGRTGSNHLRVDLSQDTAFYATGNDFDAILTAGNVGGTSVIGAPLVSFSIRHRSPLRPDSLTTSTVGAVSGAVGSVGSNVTAQSVATNVTAAQVLGNITGSVANVTNITGPVTLTTNLDKGGYTANTVLGNITGSVALVNTLTTYTGNTPQTGDVYSRVGAGGVNLTAIPNITGSVASVTGSVNSVATNVTAATLLGNITGTVARVTLVDTLTTYTNNTPQTGDGFTQSVSIYSRIGAGGSGLTSLPAMFTTSTMTESYSNVTSTVLSPAQALYQIWSLINNFSISGLALTAKKLDTSTAMIYAIEGTTAAPTGLHRTS